MHRDGGFATVVQEAEIHGEFVAADLVRDLDDPLDVSTFGSRQGRLLTSFHEHPPPSRRGLFDSRAMRPG